MADSSTINGTIDNSTTITPDDASDSNLETSTNSSSHLSRQASSLSQQNHQQQQQQPLQDYQTPDFSQFNCDIILRQILNEKKLNLMRSPEVTNFFKQIADKSFMSSNADNNSQDANN